jgi:hypothetical protein
VNWIDTNFGRVEPVARISGEAWRIINRQAEYDGQDDLDTASKILNSAYLCNVLPGLEGTPASCG